MRCELQRLDTASACAAALRGRDLDPLRLLITEHFGENVWARAIYNAPDDWEEEQMIDQMVEAIGFPEKPNSPVWILARPTRAEGALIWLAGTTGAQRAADKAVIDEAAAATTIQKYYRSRSKGLTAHIRVALLGVNARKATKACDGGLDTMGALIGSLLGTNVWARALYNAPDEWEEDEMIGALHEAILRPKDSAHLWLFAKPTKYERALVDLFKPKAGKLEARKGVTLNAHI